MTTLEKIGNGFEAADKVTRPILAVITIVTFGYRGIKALMDARQKKLQEEKDFLDGYVRASQDEPRKET